MTKEKSLIIGLLTVAVIIVSCDGNNDDNMEPVDTPTSEDKCIIDELLSITQRTVASTIERDTSSAVFVYNDQNQLIAINDTYTGEFCKSDGTCEPYNESTFNVTFSYDDTGKWSSFDYPISGGNNQELNTTVVYESNKIKTIQEDYIFENNEVELNERRFFYNESEQLVKIEYWRNKNEPTVVELVDLEEYTYAGNNITKTVLKDADGTILSEIIATFSTDPNPFKDQYQINVAELLIDQLNTPQFLFSENTVTTFQISDLEEDASVSGTVRYMFEEELLKSITITEIGEGDGINQYQFTGSINVEVNCLD